MPGKNSKTDSLSEPPKSAWEAILRVLYKKLGERGVYILVIVIGIPGAIAATYAATINVLNKYIEAPVVWMTGNPSATSAIRSSHFMPDIQANDVSFTSMPVPTNDRCTLRIAQTMLLTFNDSTVTILDDKTYSIPLKEKMRIEVEPWPDGTKRFNHPSIVKRAERPFQLTLLFEQNFIIEKGTETAESKDTPKPGEPSMNVETIDGRTFQLSVPVLSESNALDLSKRIERAGLACRLRKLVDLTGSE
jgi:hypothetical protein